jgi:lipoprotein-releasing system ATP-binding protein
MNVVISDLKKSYHMQNKEILVLNGLSLNINKGDTISLTGASGVGKTTFLQVVGTLDTPSSGHIIYDGYAIENFTDVQAANFRNKNIGFVFQFHHLLSEFTALENVVMPLLMRRVSIKWAQKKALEMLSYVGLALRTQHKPGELSGGEQQRVALARALVTEPALLLCDEPTGNLDEKTGQEIIDLILRYNQDCHTTVLIVTHNQRIPPLFKRKLMLAKEGLFCVTNSAIGMCGL